MGIFDRFRIKKEDSSVLPAEVDQYYQSEKRERRGVAVALGILTLVITLLLASGVFYGGRYAYRKITGKDKPAAVETASNNNQQAAGQQSSPTPNNSPNSAATPAPSGTTPSPDPTPSGAAPIPSTGDEPSAASLPRTGDEGM